MLLSVENDSQAVFLAPTELLSEQHSRTLRALLAPLAIAPELSLGLLIPSQSTALPDRTAFGAARIPPVTHAPPTEHMDGPETRISKDRSRAAPQVCKPQVTRIPKQSERRFGISVTAAMNDATISHFPARYVSGVTGLAK